VAELVPDQSGYVDADGHRIYWERFGTGGKETICLLNGLAMHTGAWYGFVPLLTGGFDVLLWDYLGQGNSSSEDVPFEIPRLCDYLTMIVDALGVERFHLMGISYGGFVGLDYARRYQHRLHTLTISGILLTHEELFEMYEDLSLRFYRGSTEAFEIYTHYMYEKIFGESFVVKLKPKLGAMRENFFTRFKDKRDCLIQLTEAQDRLFAALDVRLPEYRAIRTPMLLMAGAEDRAIPPWVQRKLCGILPNHRFELVADSGHCVYIEQPGVFFGNLVRFATAKDLLFEGAPAPS
jgi:3-oxoadipate enol-lactonase